MFEVSLWLMLTSEHGGFPQAPATSSIDVKPLVKEVMPRRRRETILSSNMINFSLILCRCKKSSEKTALYFLFSIRDYLYS